MEERVEKTTMTLDEAIQHCLDKSTGCDECSLEHKQLAEWLRELKELRKYKWIQVCEEIPKRINDKQDISVDILFKEGNIICHGYYDFTYHVFVSDGGACFHNVTHWMEIPE